MNEIVNNFLLAGDKLMPEMHLRYPRFTYTACGQFTEEIYNIFIKMNCKKLVFNMTWLTEVLNI